MKPFGTIAVAVLLTVGVLLIATGCGGDDASAPSESPPEEQLPSGSKGSGDSPAGESVWAEAGCGGCHTLAAAGSTGTTGPSLDILQPDLDAVVEKITSGDNHPDFADRLSEQQIADLATYLVSSTAS